MLDLQELANLTKEEVEQFPTLLRYIAPSGRRKIKAYVVAYVKRQGTVDGAEPEYLFLYRNKKAADINARKYIGLGGKLEAHENFHAALERELLEEAGVQVQHAKLNGFIIYDNLENKVLDEQYDLSAAQNAALAEASAMQIMAVYLVDAYAADFKESGTDEVQFLNAQGTYQACTEGCLEWHTLAAWLQLPHWQGDETFIKEALQGAEIGIQLYMYDSDKLLYKQQINNELFV